MSADAEAKWIAFFNHVEAECGPEGDLKLIRDVAAKAAENAARIAAVIAAVEKGDTDHIGLGSMRCGIALADWYLREALRLAHAARLDPKLARAQALLDWLRSRDRPEIGFRDILQLGPTASRSRSYWHAWRNGTQDAKRRPGDIWDDVLARLALSFEPRLRGASLLASESRRRRRQFTIS